MNTTTSTRFTAVSNLSWDGRTPSAGHPADEESFGTQAEAAEWLRKQRCGGSISTWRDGDFRIVEEIPAG